MRARRKFRAASPSHVARLLGPRVNTSQMGFAQYHCAQIGLGLNSIATVCIQVWIKPFNTSSCHGLVGC